MGRCHPGDPLNHFLNIIICLAHICPLYNYISIPSLLLSSSPTTTTAFWNVPWSVPLAP